MIVVTAPTGNIGQVVVQQLLDAGQTVRVIARDPMKLLARWRDRIEVVEGSHGDADIVDHAFAGADAVFWLAPPNPAKTLQESYLDFTQPAVQAIRVHGVARVVCVTALGRDTPWEDKAGLVSASIQMDDMLMDTGAAFRGLAMPSFMDNALMQLDAIRDGMMFGPLDANWKFPTTATRDIGVAAAKLLASPSWTGQREAPLLGPQDLSFNEMAAIMSQVLGHSVRYQQVSLESFKVQLLGYGMSQSFAQGYVDMMRAKNDGMDNLVSRTADTTAPTTYRQWCETTLKSAIVE